jgi:hypothetical protein
VIRRDRNDYRKARMTGTTTTTTLSEWVAEMIDSGDGGSVTLTFTEWNGQVAIVGDEATDTLYTFPNVAALAEALGKALEPLHPPYLREDKSLQLTRSRREAGRRRSV